MADWSRYIAIPFESKGRTWRGVDCWGMVRLIYRNELQIELPSYAEIDADDLVKVTQEIDAGRNGEAWSEVERNAIRPFDICVMKYRGLKRVGHVGIITPDGRILHTERGPGAMIVPINDITIRERIQCFRRHKQAVKS